MKTIQIVLLLALMSCFYFVQAQNIGSSAPSVFSLWATDAVFAIPESVYYDADNDVIYVANINGNPIDKDGNGFISKVTPDGKIVNLKWVTGLHAPKGMGMSGKYLFVSDVYRVVKIDVTDGTIVAKYHGEEAEFLNDVAVDANGVVYVSDMRQNYLYRLKDNALKKWLSFADYPGPNGLYAEPDRLLVGCRNQVVAVSFKDEKPVKFIQCAGEIDGLERVKGDYYLISDWTGRIHLVHPQHDKQLLLDTSSDKINAADIEYRTEGNILYVPTFYNNRVVAYDISAVVP